MVQRVVGSLERPPIEPRLKQALHSGSYVPVEVEVMLHIIGHLEKYRAHLYRPVKNDTIVGEPGHFE